MAASESYDAIVVGVGGAGSAALQHLARRGLRVLGLDALDVPHAHGSSHGGSRVIRKAYFEDPRYVPLLHRAYELWRDLEAESGLPLMHLCGGINVGRPDHECIVGVRRSAAEHRLPHEVFDAGEIRHRFPALHPADDMIGVYETDAGILNPEQCVRAHVETARRQGAEVLCGRRVRRIEWSGSGATVEADGERFAADRVVVAAGAWLPELLPIGLVLRIERQVQLWFQPHRPERFALDSLPVFIFFLADRSYYGLSGLSRPGVKVCRHHGGSTVTPDTVERCVSREDEDDVRLFIRAHLPDADGPLLDSAVCLYTNTPDEHFIIGPHPGSDRVLLVSPCSGHGFKFTAVVGEIVADLVIAGRSRHDIAMFSPARFSSPSPM